MNKIILMAIAITALMIGAFLVFNYFQKQSLETVLIQEPDQNLQLLTEEEVGPASESPENEEEATISSSENKNKEFSFLDCKEDFECFIEASKTCQPAKAVFSLTMDFFGVEQTTVSFCEIRGMQEGKCLLHLRVGEITLSFPEYMTQEIIDQLEQEYKKLEGREGICKFYPHDLTAMLIRWSQGNFDSGTISCKGNICKTKGGDFEPAECEGLYFEYSL